MNNQYINIKSVRLALNAARSCKKNPFSVGNNYRVAKSTYHPSVYSYNARFSNN